ncbi:MAG: amidohydrolase family protein [Planctomycetaceae bacterium]|nr:amidohydrolase family protein [Planctomycetaceae bacterium]
MIDVNVHLSRWPFRRLPDDDTPALVQRLRAAGVTQAWAGTFDALLHRNLSDANARLADECARHGDGLFLPFGSVNPTAPDWREDLRRCVEVHHMRGIRLYPNYHGYKLDDPGFVALLDAATERNLLVQVALKMEDERTQHPLVSVPAVDPAPLADLIAARPKLRLMVLNGLGILRGEALTKLARSGQVWFDIAMLEGVAGIEKTLSVLPSNRLAFGSHAPFFIHEAAVLKLQESELPQPVRDAIARENAQASLAAAS